MTRNAGPFALAAARVTEESAPRAATAHWPQWHRPRRFGVVVPGAVYRSGQIRPGLIRGVLGRHGIGEILNLSPYQAHKRAHVAERRAAEALGVRFRHFALSGDGTGPVDAYLEVLERMDAARQGEPPVLVHCGAGAYRTGVAVAWFRVLLEGRTCDAALREMRDFGWDPSRRTAIRYLDEHLDQVAVRLSASASLHIGRPKPMAGLGEQPGGR